MHSPRFECLLKVLISCGKVLNITWILLTSSDVAVTATVGAVEGPGAIVRPLAGTAAPEARIPAFL